MYLYSLSRQDVWLSVAELLAVAKRKDCELVENCLLLDELVDYKRLAYTKKAYRLLFSCAEEELEQKLSEFDFECIYEGSFRLDLVGSVGQDLCGLADIIWNRLKNPVTDLKNAKTKIDIIFSEKVFVCLLVGEQDDSFEDRRAHLRPYNHPTSLHPRLARCMINLADSKEILDPFCGSGGILLEAGLIGLKITGYDIDRIMIKRCDENLRHFGLKDYSIAQKDALLMKGRFEAIVTDVPYGLNSKIDDADETVKKFVLVAAEHTEKMVIAVPDSLELDVSAFWIVEQQFSFYLHRSLAKKIFVLRRK